MTLPKFKVALHEFYLPVSKQLVHYHAFTVKEEKILLMASESKEPVDLINALKQIVTNCVVEPIDAGSLPLFDLELLFLLLRSVSVSNISEFAIQNMKDDNRYNFKIDLAEVVKDSVAKAVIPSKTVQLTEELGVVIKDITLDMFMDVPDTAALSVEGAFDLLIKLIDKVYENENEAVYKISDFEKAEVVDFIESFTSDAIEKLYAHINAIPRVRHIINYKLKDGSDAELKLEGLTDFFQYA